MDHWSSLRAACVWGPVSSGWSRRSRPRVVGQNLVTTEFKAACPGKQAVKSALRPSGQAPEAQFRRPHAALDAPRPGESEAHARREKNVVHSGKPTHDPVQHSHLVRPKRKQHRTVTANPASQRLRVRRPPSPITPEPLDPPPFTLASHPPRHRESRRARLWSLIPRLRQHAAASEKTPPLLLRLPSKTVLARCDRTRYHRPQLIVRQRLIARRSRHLKRCTRRPCAPVLLIPKESLRPTHRPRPRRPAHPHTGPVLAMSHQPGPHRIGHRIRDLPNQITRLDARHMARLFTRPHALEVPVQGIHSARNERMTITREFTNPRLRVSQTDVPVIRHHHHAVQIDARTPSHHRHHIADNRVDSPGRTQAKCTPMHALGNHQARILVYRSSNRHAQANSRFRASANPLKLLSWCPGPRTPVRAPGHRLSGRPDATVKRKSGEIGDGGSTASRTNDQRHRTTRPRNSDGEWCQSAWSRPLAVQS